MNFLDRINELEKNGKAIQETIVEASDGKVVQAEFLTEYENLKKLFALISNYHEQLSSIIDLCNVLNLSVGEVITSTVGNQMIIDNDYSNDIEVDNEVAEEVVAEIESNDEVIDENNEIAEEVEPDIETNDEVIEESENEVNDEIIEENNEIIEEVEPEVEVEVNNEHEVESSDEVVEIVPDNEPNNEAIESNELEIEPLPEEPIIVAGEENLDYSEPVISTIDFSSLDLVPPVPDNYVNEEPENTSEDDMILEVNEDALESKKIKVVDQREFSWKNFMHKKLELVKALFSVEDELDYSDRFKEINLEIANFRLNYKNKTLPELNILINNLDEKISNNDSLSVLEKKKLYRKLAKIAVKVDRLNSRAEKAMSR